MRKLGGYVNMDKLSVAIEALKKIVDYTPDLQDLNNKETEIYIESENCPECQYAKTMKWSYSSLCTGHYSKISQIEKEKTIRYNSQHREMKQIAREALRELGELSNILQVNNKSRLRGEKEIMSLAKAAITQLNLPKNTAKGGWKECTEMFLCNKLNEEVEEFFNTIYEYRANPTSENRQRVREEAGDVVNIVMMLADKCGALEVER